MIVELNDGLGHRLPLVRHHSSLRLARRCEVHRMGGVCRRASLALVAMNSAYERAFFPHSKLVLALFFEGHRPQDRQLLLSGFQDGLSTNLIPWD